MRIMSSHSSEWWQLTTKVSTVQGRDSRARRYNRAVEQLLRATAAAEARHFWFRGFRLFVTPLVRDALRDRRSPRILDCGCGTGANLDWLGRFGRAYGFDLSDVGTRFARQAGRKGVVRASATAAPFPSG